MKDIKRMRKQIQRVCVLGMALMMTICFVGCETNTNAGEENEKYLSSDQTVKYNEKYLSSDETIKYEAKSQELKIDAEIKSAPEKIPQVKTTLYSPNENVVANEMLQEGIRTEYYSDDSPQYAGKNGDILNITSDGFYMLSDFYNSIYYSFHLSSKDPEYNADKYSKDTDFEFMSRKEALDVVVDKLEKCGVNLGEYKAEIYCLDYKTLEKEEQVIDEDGVAPKSEWKDSWTEDDNCYYITIRQKFNDIPEYHLRDGLYRIYEDYGSPVQAVVSKDGIRYLDVDRILQFENTEKFDIILGPDQILDKVVENKYYEDGWEQQEYTLTKMNLCYFSDIAYNKILETIPVYQLYIEEKYWDGTQWDNKICQLIIDARTGEVVEPFDTTQEIFSN